MQTMDKDDIINIFGSDFFEKFPNLENDICFEISSPIDSNYNCIAWAFHQYKDRWMQPPSGKYIPELDAVTWWPDGATPSMDISSLVEAFLCNSFIICDSWEHESGYIKIALYYNPLNNCWTHASRESRTGQYWLSKLGRSYDIHHSNPYSLEGKAYGKVFCYLKMGDD